MAEFSHYRIEIRRASDDAILRTVEPVYETRLTYSLAENALDHGGEPARVFKAALFKISDTGDVSEAQVQVVSNPAPAAPTGVVAAALGNAIEVSADPAPEPDVRGMRVWMSTSSGFTPDDTTLVYDAGNTRALIPVSQSGTYYLRVAYFDSLGTHELNLSAQVSATLVEQPVRDEIPPGDPSGLSATQLFAGAELSWTNPGDDDLSHIEIWGSKTNTFASATIYDTVAAPATALGVVGLDVGETYYFWARAVDIWGNVSNESNRAQLVIRRLIGDELEPGTISWDRMGINSGDIPFSALATIPNGAITLQQLASSIQTEIARVVELGKSVVPGGIAAGANGDLSFFANETAAGVSAVGEIGVGDLDSDPDYDGGFTHPTLGWIDVNAHTINTPWEGGANGVPTGQRFLVMYSATAPDTRFGWSSQASPQFTTVVYDDAAGTWTAYGNLISEATVFTPQPTDLIVAIGTRSSSAITGIETVTSLIGSDVPVLQRVASIETEIGDEATGASILGRIKNQETIVGDGSAGLVKQVNDLDLVVQGPGGTEGLVGSVGDHALLLAGVGEGDLGGLAQRVSTTELIRRAGVPFGEPVTAVGGADLWTNAQTGAPSSVPDAPWSPVTTAYGTGLESTTANELAAPKGVFPIEPDRTYRVTFAFSISANGAGGDTRVLTGWNALDSSYNSIATNNQPGGGYYTAALGLVTVSFLIGGADVPGAGVDGTAPSGTVYVRPQIRSNAGSSTDGKTIVYWCRVDDVTDAETSFARTAILEEALFAGGQTSARLMFLVDANGSITSSWLTSTSNPSGVEVSEAGFAADFFRVFNGNTNQQVFFIDTEDQKAYLYGDFYASGSISGEAIKASSAIQVGTGAQIPGTSVYDRAAIGGHAAGNYRFWAGGLDGASSNFSVDREGRIIARKITILTEDGSSVWFDSAYGLSEYAQAQILAQTSTRVAKVVGTTANNTDGVDFSFISNESVKAAGSINVNGIQVQQSWAYGASEPADAFPASITMQVQWRASGGTWATGVTKTYTKINSGTPTSTQFLVEESTQAPFRYWDGEANQFVEEDGYKVEVITAPSELVADFTRTYTGDSDGETYEVRVVMTPAGAPLNLDTKTRTITMSAGAGSSTEKPFVLLNGGVVPQDFEDYTPASFAPASHTHNASDINSGILDPERIRPIRARDARDDAIIDPLPNQLQDKVVEFYFQSGSYWTGSGSWRSGLSIKGWGGTYAAWQMNGPATNGPAAEDWYLRSGNDASWNPWRKIWHDGNFDPADYLPLTGGTITNPLTISNNAPRVEFTEGSGNDWWLIQDADTFSLRLNNTGTYPISVGTDRVLKTNGNTVWHAGNFTPSNYLPVSGGTITGTLTVGNGSARYWSSATDTDIDGLIPGTTSGLLFEGPGNAHFVVGIQSNDQNDGFYVIDQGDVGTTGNEPYINLLMAVSRAQFAYQGNTVWHAGNFDPTDYLPRYGSAITTQVNIDAQSDFVIRDSTNGVTNFIWRQKSTNLLYLGTANALPTFRANVNLNGFTISNGTYSGNGAALTALNASNIASGTLSDSRLPTNLSAKNFTGSVVVRYSGGGAALGVATGGGEFYIAPRNLADTDYEWGSALRWNPTVNLWSIGSTGSYIFTTEGGTITGTLASVGKIYAHGGLSVEDGSANPGDIVKVRGLYFGWSASYGTQSNHGIFSANATGAYGDNLLINSYGDVRVTIDSNGNDGNASFTVGKESSGFNGVASTELFKVREDGYTFFNAKEAFRAGDSWLRINNGGAFTSGVYFGLSQVRTDGYFRVTGAGSTVLRAYQLEVQSDTGVRNRVRVRGQGTSHTAADVLLEDDSGLTSRGLGTYLYNRASGKEWFIGQPYNNGEDRVGVYYSYQANGSEGGATATYTNRVVEFTNGGQTLFKSGLAGTPGVSFIDETTLGMYRLAAGTGAFATGGVTVFGWTTNGLVLYNNKPILWSGLSSSISATSSYVTVTTGSGYVHIGPQNGTWCHFQTDRSKFYFNQPVHSSGGFYVYNTNNYWTSSVFNCIVPATFTQPMTVSNAVLATSHVQSGKGSGGVAMTINDGYGNANLTFNHLSGTPEQNGNAARIEVNTDATSGAYMCFELKSNVTNGVAVSTTPVLNLTETTSTIYTDFTASSGKKITQASDIRLKKNIRPLEDLIDKVEPVRYDWRKTGKGDLGVIYQQLLRDIPEVCLPGEYGSVDYARLSVIAINGVKKDRERIANLEDRLARIEEMLEAA